MEISKEIHLIKMDFLVQISPEKSLPRFVNSLIIFGDYITVIDSGVKDSYKLIYDYIVSNNRKIDNIKLLILSHSHPDHIGSANRIKSDTGCRVIGHSIEKEWIENIDLQFKQRPVPGFYNLVNESVELDEVLCGGENLILDKEIEIDIINTHGHSKGSFSIFFKKDSFLFTADCIPIVNDIPIYDNYHNTIKSLGLIKSISNNCKTLLSSWSAPLNDKNEILKFITDSKQYLHKIDAAVKKHYTQNEEEKLEFCNKVINELELPSLFVVPLVDNAFRTH